ncbi:MAG: tyrosine--tRNA ligase [Pseudomonadales bacterium]|nr:tyrosine--tRNA ligase [Pseudomonadales bacterium]MDA0955645.1 tyrosine--tRNA ligase [Pseudomonadota bacterium]
MDVLEELKWRGLVNQSSPWETLAAQFASPGQTVYCGFDPTADSLHIGSLVPLLALRRFQLAGHRPIALVGGATGLIGDPSFKANERSLNEADVVAGWVESLRQQLGRFIDLDQGAGLLVNNLDWTRELDVIAFLRDVGKHFSVNEMIRKESVRSRIEREGAGISFTEFSYMLLQSYDYTALADRYDCVLQLGGSDQWGNITAGMDLTRRMLGKTVHALTLPLVTRSDGGKFGKTESGTIWLDARKTSPYTFYQFWINCADADVPAYLRYFTFLERDALEAVVAESEADPGKRLGQQVLAREVTTLVHGEAGCAAAERITAALFSGSLDGLGEADLAQLAQDGVPSAHFDEGSVFLGRVLTELGLAGSNSQAMQLIKSGAVAVNGAVAGDARAALNTFPTFVSGHFLIRRGKRQWGLARLSGA